MAPNLLSDKAKQYFADLNPLASKISSDISVITEAYAHLWNEFSIDEQHDVINVTMIKPEVVLKYFNGLTKFTIDGKKESIDKTKFDPDSDDNMSFTSSNNSTNFNHIYLYNGKDLCTYQQIITALKYSQDDLCGVYRDEHSEPFNSKTKSQMNLNFTPSSTDNDGFNKANIKLNGTIIDSDVKKGLEHLFDTNSKCSTLKMENMQDCRKSFMSKLFSGKSNTLGISPGIRNFDANNEIDSTRTPNEIRISLTHDFDSLSTKSAHSDDKNEPTDQSRLIADKDDNDDDQHDDESGNECEKYQQPNKYDIPNGYDFLNNW